MMQVCLVVICCVMLLGALVWVFGQLKSQSDQICSDEPSPKHQEFTDEEESARAVEMAPV